MEILIIYDLPRYKKNKEFARLLSEKCLKYGLLPRLVFVEDFPLKGSLPKYAVMRAVSFKLTAFLEERGVRVFNNSRVSGVCNDKYETYRFLESRNISVLPYRLITRTDAPNIELTEPHVFKSRCGHGGNEVFWVETAADIASCFSKIRGDTAIIQKPVSDIGKDLRTYIIGGKPVCSILRESASDFRSNYSLGGSASPRALTNTERREIDKITALFDFDFVGIDLIYDGGKPIFNEIEDVAGCRTVYASTDVDPADLFVRYIASVVK
ncbi:MAG: hypothetical protein LBT30_02520 [Clostridiales bacterium]|jgi:glutathione synthase/RimK-type ligase-like ATP-grasp enzyme|nr:hypothetical protein [Clostridiales bacterium]